MPALRVYGIPQVNAQLLSHVDKLEKKKERKKNKKKAFPFKWIPFVVNGN